MRAVTWQGTRAMRVETVPDPEIVQQSDVVVKVSATAICGPDHSPPGAYHLRPQFMAPRATNTASFGLQGTMLPSAIDASARIGSLAAAAKPGRRPA